MMEESIFKSCLKRKVKFTASTFVKFLITGTVALSLTACGGGGGGGGSSSSGGNGGGNTPAPITKEEVVVKDGENYTNTSEIDLTEKSQADGKGVAGISGKNSTIINNGTIKIDDKPGSNTAVFLASDTGENVLNELKNRGESFAIFSENGKVTNGKEGNLIIKGDSVHGIFGLYSEITNNGII